MTTADTPAGFRRVLVALDSSAASDATLAVAAGIAAAQACELTGLFIEDQDLLHLAGLPFAREFQLAKSMNRALGPEELLRDLRAQAGVARAAMARQAALHRLAWSFHVVQGRSEEAVLLAAARGDIVAMARGFGPLASGGGVSRRMRRVAALAPGPLLLVGASPAAGAGPILLPYDASPAAESALELAAGLARTRGQALELVLLGEAVARGAEIETRLRALADKPRLPALRLWPARDRGAALRRLFEAERGLLVLPADAPCFAQGDIDQIIERVRLPVILQTEEVSAGPQRP